MPIAICSNCGLPTPNGFNCFSHWCRCKTSEEWISYYKRRGWTLNADQLKLMRGEKVFPVAVENYIDWPKMRAKMKRLADEELASWNNI